MEPGFAEKAFLTIEYLHQTAERALPYMIFQSLQVGA